MTSLVGLKYRLGGRSAETGVDCLGLVLLQLESRGVPAFDPWRQFRFAFLDGWTDFREAMPEGWTELNLALSTLQDDDILMMHSGTVIQHVAIVTHGGKRILTTTGDGGRSASLRLAPRRRTIINAWRHESRC